MGVTPVSVIYGCNLASKPWSEILAAAMALDERSSREEAYLYIVVDRGLLSEALKLFFYLGLTDKVCFVDKASEFPVDHVRLEYSR